MSQKIFYQKLRYWTLHCTLNSLPSFGIAMFYLDLRNYPEAVAAMICAVVTFILLYTVFTSSMLPLRDETHLLSRALRVGTRIRMAISCISTVLLPIPFVLLFMPDTWCGMLAVGAMNFIGKHFRGVGPGYYNNFADTSTMMTGGYRFFSTYAVTMMEGFIISFLLLMISFFAVIFLQSKDRKRALSDAFPLSSKRS